MLRREVQDVNDDETSSSTPPHRIVRDASVETCGSRSLVADRARRALHARQLIRHQHVQHDRDDQHDAQQPRQLGERPVQQRAVALIFSRPTNA